MIRISHIAAIATYLVFFLTLTGTARQINEDSLQKKYKFLNLGENEIRDYGSRLDSVFMSLSTMQETNRGNVSILHIGDSHLAEPALASAIRRGLQQVFGNGGRGLVLPYSTGVQFRNEQSYRWKTVTVKGKKKKVKVARIKRIPIGPAQLVTTKQEITVTLDSVKCADYAFSRVTLLYPAGSCSSFTISTDCFPEPQLITGFPLRQSFSKTSCTLNLRSACPDSTTSLNGINLENESTGILYHAVSIDGADIPYYLNSRYIGVLIRELHPDLIILSLGTNDVFGKAVTAESFRANLISLCDTIRMYAATDRLLITSPPDCYRKRREVRTLPVVESVMEEYCKENGYAFWDWYRVMGDKKSMPKWQKASLARADKVHFTTAGYTLQATLFVSAFLKAYQRYAQP